jgi:hypothetical protein
MMPATPIGIAIQQPAMAVPPQAVYNPAPPVKPVVKQSSGCMGLLVGMLTLATAVALLGVTYLH